MPALQLIADLPGHAEPAWQVAFNPTRSLLASCSTDKTVRLYSYALPTSSSSSSSASDPSFPHKDDPRPSFSYTNAIQTEHKRTIRSISWAPSGRILATGSFDSSVGVWEEADPDDPDEDDTERVYRPTQPPSKDHEEDEMDVPPRGETGEERKEWECVTTLEGHESECKSVGWSHDGGLLGSCSRDKSVWVWEVQPDSDFECIAVMMEHSQDVKCIAWHPREEILASASYDSHIHLLFDDPDGDWCTFQKLHPKLQPSQLHVSNPSPSLVSALAPNEEDKAVDELKVPPLEEDETVWSIAWSPCGGWLASGGDLGGIRLWRRKGHHPDSQFEEVVHTVAHTRSVFSLSWSPGGSSSSNGGMGLLASGGGDGKIIVWQVELRSKDEIDPSTSSRPSIRPVAAAREAHGVSDVNSVAWCLREDGKGRGILSSCGDDGTVKVWQVVGE